MTTDTTNNKDNLIEILNAGDTSILNYNIDIENDISNNGGVVVYSFYDKNIIIATEISEEYFVELSKDNRVDYIEDVPLKGYGDIDYNLIDQIDKSLLKSSLENKNVNSGVTNIFEVGEISDIVSGDSNISLSDYLKVLDTLSGKTDGNSGKTSSTISKNTNTMAPHIINTIFTLDIIASHKFTYEIIASGTTPMRYEIRSENFYIQQLIDNGDIINGYIRLDKNIISGMIPTEFSGIITFEAINYYGSATTGLTINTTEDTIITSDLNVYSSFGSQFSYTMTSRGPSPKNYTILETLPTNISCVGDKIFGKFSEAGSYDINIKVVSANDTDTKKLTVNVGTSPVITSDGAAIFSLYTVGFYTITTSDPTSKITIQGTLPNGLVLVSNADGSNILGSATDSGITNVTICAENKYGIAKKQLTITIDSFRYFGLS